MYRNYKYLLKPNNSQIQRIERNISGCNLVRNLCIENGEIELARTSANSLIKKYITQFPYLGECDFSALINTLFKLTDEAGVVKTRDRNGYSTTYSDYLKLNYPLSDKKVFLSRVGYVRFNCHRPLPSTEDIFRFTVIKSNGRYYLLVSFVKTPVKNIDLDIRNSVGLDYSSTYFAVNSEGYRYGIEHFYREIEPDINKYRRELIGKKKGSIRYKEIDRCIRKLYQKSARKRDDYLHKLSTELADKYDYIMIETLDIKSIANGYNLGKATSDNAFSKFVKMLSYKMEDRGKVLIKIPKYYPSTRLCSNCNNIRDAVPLHVRKWKCEVCGAEHDRDINAAINILRKGVDIANKSKS